MRVGKVRLKWKLQSEDDRFPRQSNNYATNRFTNREMYCNNLDLICQLHRVDTALIDPGSPAVVGAGGQQRKNSRPIMGHSSLGLTVKIRMLTTCIDIIIIL